MKYSLFEAVDQRGDKTMLWLHDPANNRVALFCKKTAPSRVKRLTAVAPDGITWEHRNKWIDHAVIAKAKLIDSWEFSS